MRDPAIRIRDFDAKRDMARFVSLNMLTFHESMPPGERAPIGDWKKHYESILERFSPHDPDKSRISVAASVADDYLGHCWLGLQHDFFSGELMPWILDLTVKPALRGQGIGTLLLEECAEKVRSMGLGSIGLQVMWHNPRARAFYERAGFEMRAVSMLRRIALK